MARFTSIIILIIIMVRFSLPSVYGADTDPQPYPHYRIYIAPQSPPQPYPRHGYAYPPSPEDPVMEEGPSQMQDPNLQSAPAQILTQEAVAPRTSAALSIFGKKIKIPQFLKPKKPGVSLPPGTKVKVETYLHENWMRDNASYLKDRPLKYVAMPGTHDSATHTLSAASQIAKNQAIHKKLNWLKYAGVGFALNQIIANWGKAQGKNLYLQLMDGIRYLDLRFVYRDSKRTHYSAHGLYGQSVEEIIQDIKKFTDTHPKEIIIIQIGDLNNYMVSEKYGDTNAELIGKFEKAFSPKLVDEKETPSVTVGKLWEMGKQIILIYNDVDWALKKDFLWPQESITSRWPNVIDPAELFRKLESYFPERKDDPFFVLQCIMTSNDEVIKKALNPFYAGPKSLKDFARIVEVYLPGWIRGWSKRTPNIIIADFFENKDIIKQIIDINK